MASQDPTKPRDDSPDENMIRSLETQAVKTDITGESHVRAEPIPEGTAVEFYNVQEGDSLASIAEKFYGDRNQWMRIRNANRDRIAEHDRLDVGSQLRIPLD